MEIIDRGHSRQPVAPALFGRGHHHALPVRQLLFGPLAREAHHAALGRQGLDRGHSELNRLFNDPVHLGRFG
jgi:hypothetical protein